MATQRLGDSAFRLVFCRRIQSYRVFHTSPFPPRSSTQRRWAATAAAETPSSSAPMPPPIPPSPPPNDLPLIGKSTDPFSTPTAQAYLDSEPPREKQPLWGPVPERHRTIAVGPPVDPKDPLKPDPKLNPHEVEAFKASLTPFSQLKGKVEYDTLKAIIVKPFKFQTMTPVQSAVLQLLPELADPQSGKPRDLLVRASPDSGKTLSYVVPSIEARLKAIERFCKLAVKESGLTTDKHLMGRAKRVFTRGHVGTLILCPTRELATQVANDALKAAHHHGEFEVRLIVGGESKKRQLRDFMKGRRDIVVATPGRLRDLLENEDEIARGMAKAQMLVLDEADTLLDMGFRDDIDAIVAFLPDRGVRQTLIYTATASMPIRQVTKALLQPDHLFLDTVQRPEASVVNDLPQFHTVLPGPQHQLPHLLRLVAHDQLTNPGASKIAMFLPTTKMAQLFATLLRALQGTLPAGRETRVYEIHAKRGEDQRYTTSQAFREDRSGASVLVTSDVSSRGVDFPGVSRVIQVGVPPSTDLYVYRVSRAGKGRFTDGRGDLVLLPWEIGFLTWQLGNIPMKPCTVGALAEELHTLAGRYDADPLAFFAGILQQGDRKDLMSKHAFLTPVESRVRSVSEQFERLLPSIDELAVKETFASLLGYYIPKHPEVRTSRQVIVQGCKDWATGACGLAREPFVSEEFLRRLGMQDGRTKHFGGGQYMYRTHGDGSSSKPWTGRGMQRLKGREVQAPDWEGGSQTLPEGDPDMDANQYRTARYGQAWRLNEHGTAAPRRQHSGAAGTVDGAPGRPLGPRAEGVFSSPDAMKLARRQPNESEFMPGEREVVKDQLQLEDDGDDAAELDWDTNVRREKEEKRRKQPIW